MSVRTLAKVADLFYELCVGEQKVELTRLGLAGMPDFDLTSAFNELAWSDNGCIDLSDLKDFMDSNFYSTSIEDLRLLKRISPAEVIDRNAFNLLVTPRISKVNQGYSRAHHKPLGKQARTKLALLIYREIAFLKRIEELKERFYSPNEVDLYRIFKAIVGVEEGMSRSRFHSFMWEQGCDLSELSVDFFFERWSISKSKLEYVDFLKATMPLIGKNLTWSLTSNSPSIAMSPPPKSLESINDIYKTPQKSSIQRTSSILRTASTERSEGLQQSPYSIVESPPRSAFSISQLQSSSQKYCPEKDIIIEFFKLQLEKEAQLDKELSKLGYRYDFSLMKLWKYFKPSENYLTIDNLAETAERLLINTPRVNLINLMRVYDSKAEGCLSYDDLRRMFDIPTNQYNRLSSNSASLSVETEVLIARVFNLHLGYETDIEKLRLNIAKKKINLYKTFNEIDIDGDNYLSKEDISHVLPHRSDSSLSRLINTFKSSPLGVSYFEFIQEVTPKSPSKPY